MSLSLHYCNEKFLQSQGELFDYNPLNERIIDWKYKKQLSLEIADSFKRLKDYKSYNSIHYCGTDLIFKEYSSGDKKLYRANFCKHRLCPMCGWRKSLKKYAQVSQMMNYLSQFNYLYLFVTVTIKNVIDEDLSKSLDILLNGYHKLFREKRIKNSFLGAFRSLEVTYNRNTHTFHPHIHFICAVSKSYFNNSKLYISQKYLTDAWKNALSLDYTPIVNIKRVKSDANISHAIAEIAKYTVKSTDYIIPDNISEQDHVIDVLNYSLKGRRLISVRGVFKKAQQALKIDLEDENLVINDLNTELNHDLEYVLVHYKWDFFGCKYKFNDVIDEI